MPLRDTTLGSGWILLAAVLFLASYNLRKKLTYPPLLSSATWLRLHVYVGVGSIVGFLWHIGWRMPNGLLEGALAAVYVGVAASGHDNNPRFIRHGPTIGHHMIVNACMHCADPVCMIGCPTGAIHRSEEGGEVVINDLTCIGCGTCAASCPYDNIRMVEIRDRSSNDAIMIDPVEGKAIVKATKCDLCIDHHGGPACERACPHDALKRVDMRDMDVLAQWLER